MDFCHTEHSKRLSPSARAMKVKELGLGVGRVFTTGHPTMINSIMALSISYDPPVLYHSPQALTPLTERLLSSICWVLKGVSQFFVGVWKYIFSVWGHTCSCGSIFTGAGSLMGRLFNTTHQHFSSKLHLAPKAFVSSSSSSFTCHHHAIMRCMDSMHFHILVFIHMYKDV